MSRRPSGRVALTTLAAAAVLVGGADLTSYAANGHPLVLGHSNAAVGTTTLKNAGRGPALALKTERSAAPFTVTSSRLVKHLNAATVGGRSAAQLDPKTIRLRFGATGSTSNGDGFHLRSATVPKGTYAVGVTGLVIESASNTGDNITCLIADRAMIVGALNGGPLNFAQVYAIDGAGAGDVNFGVVDNQNLAQRINRPVAFGCSFTGAGQFQEVRGVTFTLTPVTVSDKNSKPIPLTKAAQHRRLGFH